MMDGGWKPHVEICPPCPRCGSSNTKFCYYNNYSLTQPRYFCKGCRRYWTRGGSLRNVPVGVVCRKSRRGRSIRIPTTCSASRNNNSSNGGNIDAASSSAIRPNATNIDLAQVYANFMNQRPHESNTDDHLDQRIPQLPSEVDSPLEFDSIAPNLDTAFGAQMSQENGMLFECGTFSGRSSETYLAERNEELFCGFDSIHNNPERVHEYFCESTNQIIGNQELPPLPGEELVWSSSHMVVSDHILPLGFPPEGQDPLDQLIRHRSMFDMPNYEVLFKPWSN